MITFRNGKLTATIPNQENTMFVTESKNSGMWYYEFPNILDKDAMFGFSYQNQTTYSKGLYLWGNNGNLYGTLGINITYSAPPIKLGDTVGVLLDLNSKQVAFSVNGTLYPFIKLSNVNLHNFITPSFTSPSSSSGSTATINLGSSEFIYPIPLNYKAYDYESYKSLAFKPSIFIKEKNKLLTIQKNNLLNVNSLDDILLGFKQLDFLMQNNNIKFKSVNYVDSIDEYKVYKSNIIKKSEISNIKNIKVILDKEG